MSSFSREYTEYTEEEGFNGRCKRFKNVDYDALHMHTGSLKIRIFKVLFWEGRRGVTKKSTVYAFYNVDNYGRPLRNSHVLPCTLTGHGEGGAEDRRVGERDEPHSRVHTPPAPG